MKQDTNVIDLAKHRISKFKDESTQELFTLDDVEEIAWSFLENILSKEELQEIAYRLEGMRKDFK